MKRAICPPFGVVHGSSRGSRADRAARATYERWRLRAPATGATTAVAPSIRDTRTSVPGGIVCAASDPGAPHLAGELDAATLTGDGRDDHAPRGRRAPRRWSRPAASAARRCRSSHGPQREEQQDRGQRGDDELHGHGGARTGRRSRRRALRRRTSRARGRARASRGCPATSAAPTHHSHAHRATPSRRAGFRRRTLRSNRYLDGLFAKSVGDAAQPCGGSRPSGPAAARRGRTAQREVERPRQGLGGEHLVDRTGRERLALAQQQDVREAGRDLLDVVRDEHEHRATAGRRPARTAPRPAPRGRRGRGRRRARRAAASSGSVMSERAICTRLRSPSLRVPKLRSAGGRRRTRASRSVARDSSSAS